MYRIDDWINENERSGWIVELIESQYIDMSTYRPLSGSSYIKLRTELRSSKKRTNKTSKMMIKNVFFDVMSDILIQ